MRLSDSIRFYAATDVGKVRDHNEDNFLVDKKLGLFIVADVLPLAIPLAEGLRLAGVASGFDRVDLGRRARAAEA